MKSSTKEFIMVEFLCVLLGYLVVFTYVFWDAMLFYDGVTTLRMNTYHEGWLETILITILTIGVVKILYNYIQDIRVD